jgi:hypothetical protein
LKRTLTLFLGLALSVPASLPLAAQRKAPAEPELPKLVENIPA